jgi:protein-tyrosine phosphatase
MTVTIVWYKIKKTNNNLQFFVLVYFYNFGWKDYGQPSLHSLLNVVKVVAFAQSQGKVAVHCHAGTPIRC